MWIGLGSNLLVRDGGIRGAVIETHGVFDELERRSDNEIWCGSGVACAKLAKQCIKWGLGPAEFFAGIPGTLGGALAMNAGAFGGETWRHVLGVATIDRDGVRRERPASDYVASYRHVSGPRDEWFLGARLTFELRPGVSNEDIRLLLARRKATQPIGEWSCGSVFTNPPGDHAARLIDSAGLKGHRIGGARVSEMHANFIVNDGTASAADIEQLIQSRDGDGAARARRAAQARGAHRGRGTMSMQTDGSAGLRPRSGVARRALRPSARCRSNSGKNCLEALLRRDVDAHPVDGMPALLADIAAKRCDRVFNIMHGGDGENGVVQGLLDALRVPYTGSGVLGSALTLDKIRTKQVWLSLNLPTPRYARLSRTDDVTAAARWLGLPVIVKPACEGSSVGVSRVFKEADLPQAVALAARYEGELLMEQLIEGEEFTVGILNDEALPTIRIVPAGEYYDYHAKYVSDDTQYSARPARHGGNRDARARARSVPHRCLQRLGSRRPDARSRRRQLPAGSEHHAGHDQSFAGAEGREGLRHRVRRSGVADSGNESVARIPNRSKP